MRYVTSNDLAARSRIVKELSDVVRTEPIAKKKEKVAALLNMY